MILITGGAGFIGSVLAHELNNLGRSDLLIVDRLGTSQKWKNIAGLEFIDYINADQFLEILPDIEGIDFIFHLGACSSTTEIDCDYLWFNNVMFSKILFDYATVHRIPFIYASSAATYGLGENGYSDQTDDIGIFRPLNPYGQSKQWFDQWVLRQMKTPPFWAGIKFFNVYGPNEGHKGEMRSLVHKAHGQILETGKVKLFKSHRSDYKDGEQRRDFIYVKDAVAILLQFMISLNGNKNKQNSKGKKKVTTALKSGLYNLGTGQAHTFKQLVQATFKAMGRAEKIEYIDMPYNIREQYQYFTQADQGKLKALFPHFTFTPLEKAVADYVQGHLDRKEGHY